VPDPRKRVDDRPAPVPRVQSREGVEEPRGLVGRVGLQRAAEGRARGPKVLEHKDALLGLVVATRVVAPGCDDGEIGSNIAVEARFL
jgi:hypothetical protein